MLERYGTGMAFALAESVEEARMLIQAKLRREADYLFWGGHEWSDEGDERHDQEVLAFLDNAPEVYGSPVAFFQMGSE